MAAQSLLSGERGASDHPARVVVMEDWTISSSNDEETSDNALSNRNDHDETVTIHNSFEKTDQNVIEQVGAGPGSKRNNDEPFISSSSCNCLSTCIRFCYYPYSYEYQLWLIRENYQLRWIALWATFLVRICLYTMDWVFDILLLVEYGTDDHWWYFGHTFVFVFLPALIISCRNWNYNSQKQNFDRKIRETNYELREKILVDPPWKFRFRRLCCIFLISPIPK